MDFTAKLTQLQELGAEVLGISRDSTASHRRFKEKHGLKVDLASDPDHKVTEAYGAWAKKKMYGKESYGVVRSTVLIDPEGNIAHIWKKVSVKGHAEAVAEKLQDLRKERN